MYETNPPRSYVPRGPPASGVIECGPYSRPDPGSRLCGKNVISDPAWYRRYQSVRLTVFSGAHIITVL